MADRTPSHLRTWLQLLRAPNLFTVPGDPVGGYLLSNAGFTDHTLWLVAGASLCFYGAGLLQNDLVDVGEDRAERPNRPLPSGLASTTSVRRALVALNAFGLLLLLSTGRGGPVLLGALTVLAVWSYNTLTKRIAVVGALNMGLCRGLSVMTGALAGPAPYAAPIAGLFAMATLLFIAAVTHLARFETRPKVPVLARCLPVIPLLGGAAFGAQNAYFSPDKLPAIGCFALAAAGGAWLLRELFRARTPLPPLIGAHIRLLLPLQAGVCWLGASQSVGPYWAAGLLALWPVSRMVSKRFYAS